MVTTDILTKFGLTKDTNNSKLKEVLKYNTKVKEIHIDIYLENPLISSTMPFMLLLRTIEKNVTVGNEDDRLILQRDDMCNTYLINILFSKITDCFFKISEDFSEFILNIQNVYYRIIVLN